MPVYYQRTELANVVDKYRLIRDCLNGAKAVKARGELYLPKPNPTDTSDDNKKRYDAYKRRAVFVATTSRTLLGMLGQVLERPPVVEIPNSLDMMKNDVSGSGVTLNQSAMKTLGFVASMGRCGLLVDYPKTQGNVTAKDKAEGVARPTITVYSPEMCVNWRTFTEGASVKLGMVVIAEAWPFQDDGFEIKTACQFRVLRLVENPAAPKGYAYQVQIWREPQPTTWTAGGDLPARFSDYKMTETIWPTGPSGELLDEIPFMFVGSHNNDPEIDNPPMYDLAELNIAHYRNSADYEEAVYMMGQPTYWFSGLTKEWIKEVLGGKIQLGSVGGVLLPANSSAGLLQPTPNTMAKEAMDQKENQMVGLGAKLVQKVTVQRTATESLQDKATENSILSNCAKNVSEAYSWAFRWAAYLNGDIRDLRTALADDTIKFVLNDDYSMLSMDWQAQQQLLKTWQSGGITFGEYRSVLHKIGIATLDDEEAQTTIQDEQVALMKKMAAENPQPNNQPANNKQ